MRHEHPFVPSRAPLSRVLLTGASGFIGRHALSLLVRNGHEVHAVARDASSRASSPEVLWHEVDLLDDTQTVSGLVASVRPERLLHLAWCAEHGRFWTSPKNVRWVEASLALLRAFAAAGGRRAVIAGTCAEYDWAALPAQATVAESVTHAVTQAVALCRENDTPVAPHTLYGACKHAVHLVAERYAEQTGIELAWGRVFFLYGPDEQPGRLVPSVAASLLSGASTPTSDGRQVRDFMHVEDVAAGFVALLEGDVVGTVNVASGEPVSVRAVVERIAALVGRPELVRWGAIARAPADPAVLVADVARLREEVKFTPSVGLDAGLDSTVRWLREHLDG